MTRRNFIATHAAAALATQLPAIAAPAESEKLAKDGGPKAVTAKPGKWVRWDDRERQQLSGCVDQPSLFYWGPGRGPNKQTALFIERFKQHCPADHVVTCSSGTAAVHIAIATAGIGPGDEVITTPITDLGTVAGILFQQAVPVFADLEPSTYNLDPASVARCITPRTKAIVAVHLAGTPCDLEPLAQLARQHGLTLIEDCAQAWGARYRGKQVGTFGQAACYSLMNSKHIGAGDGGVVASSDPKLGPALLKFSDKGNDRTNPDYNWGKTDVLATNYRMSELQAGFGAAQLQRLEEIASRRAALGRLLAENIAGLPAVMPPALHAEDRPTFWFFYFRVRPEKLRCTRDEFAAALRAEGAPCSPGYIPVPIYRLPFFREHAFFAGRWPIKELGLTHMDYSQVRCPEAEAILATGISCTLNESMNEQLVREIAAAIRKVAQHYTVT